MKYNIERFSDDIRTKRVKPCFETWAKHHVAPYEYEFGDGYVLMFFYVDYRERVNKSRSNRFVRFVVHFTENQFRVSVEGYRKSHAEELFGLVLDISSEIANLFSEYAITSESEA